MAQSNPITTKSIPLLRILDALKLIRRIPGTTPDECTAVIKKLISSLSEKEQKALVVYAEKYQPSVRALLGAILEELEAYELLQPLRANLNGVTSYKLSISDIVLPTKKNWNIFDKPGAKPNSIELCRGEKTKDDIPT